MNSNDMRQVLLKEAKPVVELLIDKSNPVERTIFEYFDKRIKTLNDKGLKKVFDSFIQLKEQSKKDLTNESLWIKFYLTLCWSYQDDNKWY